MRKKPTPLLPTRPKWCPRPQYLLPPRILTNPILSAVLTTVTPCVFHTYSLPISPRSKDIAGKTDVVRAQVVAVPVVFAHATEGGRSPAGPAVRAERWEGRFPSFVEREGPDFGEGDWASTDEVCRADDKPVVPVRGIRTAVSSSTATIAYHLRLSPCVCFLRVAVPIRNSSFVGSIDIDGVIIAASLFIIVAVRVGILDGDGAFSISMSSAGERRWRSTVASPWGETGGGDGREKGLACHRARGVKIAAGAGGWCAGGWLIPLVPA